jgi:hypothetical protein
MMMTMLCAVWLLVVGLTSTAQGLPQLWRPPWLASSPLLRPVAKGARGKRQGVVEGCGAAMRVDGVIESGRRCTAVGAT